MSARLALLAATAALAGALAGAGPALAYKDVAYSAFFEATGSFRYSDFDGDEEYYNAQDIDLEFAFEGSVGDEVVFRDGHVIGTWGADLPSAAVTGTWVRRSPGETKTCEGIDEHPAHGWTRIGGQFDPSEDAVPLEDADQVYLRPFDELEPMWSCADDTNFQWDLVTTGMAADAVDEYGVLWPGRNPFDIEFDLPREAIGMGYVEQVLPQRVFDGEDTCPNGARWGVTECRLEWSGKVTFRKLWERRGGGALSATSARLSRRGDRAAFKVACEAACRGTATLTVRGGKAVRVRFSAPAGEERAVTIRLGAQARRAVRRGRTVRISVTAVADGARSTAKLELRRQTARP